MKKLLSLSLMVLSGLLSACSSTRALPVVAQRDTVVMVNHQLDSVYLHDSVYIREYMRGDTIYVDRWRDRYKDRVVAKTDTVYLTKTITKTLPSIEKKTAKEIPRFYKWCTAFFWLILIGVVAYVILRIYLKR